jgi:hypothetical protein
MARQASQKLTDELASGAIERLAMCGKMSAACTSAWVAVRNVNEGR